MFDWTRLAGALLSIRVGVLRCLVTLYATKIEKWWREASSHMYRLIVAVLPAFAPVLVVVGCILDTWP